MLINWSIDDIVYTTIIVYIDRLAICLPICMTEWLSHAVFSSHSVAIFRLHACTAAIIISWTSRAIVIWFLAGLLLYRVPSNHWSLYVMCCLPVGWCLDVLLTDKDIYLRSVVRCVLLEWWDALLYSPYTQKMRLVLLEKHLPHRCDG